MKDCIFCKIVNGEIPCYKLYEDEHVIAFLDISQVTKGHALVVPKEHYDNFLSTPKEIMHHVYDVAQRIGQVHIQIYHAKGVNILTNCYEAAGQSVMHFHVHVIPRYSSADSFILEMKDSSEHKANLAIIASEIKDNI